MRQSIWFGGRGWIGCLGLLWLWTQSGCVLNTEYTRMQRALGAEILDLRQGKKRNDQQLADLNAEINRLRAQVKAEKTSYAALEKRFQVEMDKQKKLELRIQNILGAQKLRESELSKCGQMLQGRGKQLFELQTQLAKKQQELTEKENLFNQKQEEFKKKNEALLADIQKKQQALQASLERVRRLEKQINALRRVYSELANRLRGLVNAGKLKISMVRGLLVLQLPEKILFSSGQATVKREGRSAINKVATILKDMKYRWQIGGHTDSMGSANFNWRLSSRRALAVLFVMLKSGMAPEQLSIAGFGQYQPTAGNDTADNRSLNRRTELILVPDLSELYPSLQVGDGKDAPAEPRQ